MPPLRLGIIGCGAVTQVQHLPNLMELQEEFAVTIVCDRSSALARWVADQFHIPRHVSDHRDLLAADIDAVLLCHSDPKTEVAVASFAAGKHVFIEKPVCYSLEEMDAISEAAQAAGTVAQVGYMKVYDPAFLMAQREVEAMNGIRFAQVNHLHVDNKLHLAQFQLKSFDDIPEAAVAAQQTARRQALKEALGEPPPEAERAFFILSGSAIHDLYGLRTLFGQPERVASTEVWYDGWGINTVLQYAGDFRCALTWVELLKVWAFEETLEVYGDDRRVLLSYPSGFTRGQPSDLAIHGINAAGTSYRQQPAVPWDNPFTNELRHFHECITEGVPCRTPLSSARDDVSLIIDIVRAYIAGSSR